MPPGPLLKDAETVDLGGNTFSLEACEVLAKALEPMTFLKHLKFDDMFTRRKVDSIHPSLRLFSSAVVAHNLVYLDLRWVFFLDANFILFFIFFFLRFLFLSQTFVILSSPQSAYIFLTLSSDNALNPVGAEAIGPLLSNCLSITTLKLNNTGVGPSGGEVYYSYSCSSSITTWAMLCCTIHI